MRGTQPLTSAHSWQGTKSPIWQRLERLIADLLRDIEDQMDFENRYRRFG
jgi:hypothetical protein